MLYTRSGNWGSFTYTEQDITVLEVADNIQGVTAKFKAATLQELWEIGFIENLPSEDAVRQKTINDALIFA